jgi:hypothetical protein
VPNYTLEKKGKFYTLYKYMKEVNKWGNLREGDTLDDPGVDGRMILKWIFEKRDVGMNWIDLTLDRDR